jgi:hypothetical protein
MSPQSIVPVLPTLDRLGVSVDYLQNVDAAAAVHGWFTTFAQAIESGSVADIVAHFSPVSAAWRDLLGLSWDLRTLHGQDNIRRYLEENLVSSGLSELQLNKEGIALQQATADLAWLEGTFAI